MFSSLLLANFATRNQNYRQLNNDSSPHVPGQPVGGANHQMTGLNVKSGYTGGQGGRGIFQSFRNIVGNVYLTMVLCIMIWIIIISQLICEFLVYPGADLMTQIMPRSFIYPVLLMLLIFYFPAIYASPTYQYLSNFDVNQKIYEIVDRTIKEKPIIELHVSCYHYETRHYTTRDANGRTQMQTRTVRVNTHSESRVMPFEFHRDFSPRFVLRQTKKHFIKLKMSQFVFISDERTHQILDEERESIYVDNRGRDQYMDYGESWGTPNFESRLMTANPDKKTPYFATSPFWYLLSCLFFLGWIYTFWFNTLCDEQGYGYVKEVSNFPFTDGRVDNNFDPSMIANVGRYGGTFDGAQLFQRTWNSDQQTSLTPLFDPQTMQHFVPPIQQDTPSQYYMPGIVQPPPIQPNMQPHQITTNNTISATQPFSQPNITSGFIPTTSRYIPPTI